MMGEGKHIYKRGYLRGIFIHIYPYFVGSAFDGDSLSWDTTKST
jgi:hypothetical protein